MRALIDVNVMYCEYQMSKAEYNKFCVMVRDFNKKFHEGEHDPSDAVREVYRDKAFVPKVMPAPQADEIVVSFVVKEHLAEDWYDIFFDLDAKTP